MKAIKFFSVAIAMAFAMSANAQFVSSGGGSKGSSRFSSAELDPKAHFMADIKFGSVASAGGFGLNIGGTKDFATFGGCTLAWDFVNVEFAAPFKSPADCDYLSLKTGLRLFTPSFAKDKVRIYTNLSMGYTCVLTKGGSFSINGKDEIKEAFYNYVNYEDTYMENYYEDLFKNVCEKYGYSENYIMSLIDGDYMEELLESRNADSAWSYFSSALTGANSKMSANHGFGLTWGVGVQINKKFSIGYTLQYETAFKSKNHLATFGYTF